MNVAADFIERRIIEFNFRPMRELCGRSIEHSGTQFAHKADQFRSSKFISADMVEILIYFNAFL
jgi:hypothetical protein